MVVVRFPPGYWFHTKAKVVVLYMLKTIIICITVIYIVRLLITNNIFIGKLNLRIKILGLHLEVSSKEKRHSSDRTDSV